MDIDTLAGQADQLRRGRTMLFVATAGALLALLGTLGHKPVLSVIGWATAVLGGLGGISESARALGTPALLKFAGMLAALVPVLNVPVLAGFAWHSQRGLAGLDDTLRREKARARRAQRAAEPASRPGSTAPQAAARPATARPAAGARQAIACVKSILESAVADQWVSANLRPGQDLPRGMPDSMPAGSQPMARICGGHFIVVYLIDEGDQFRYAVRDDLAAAGLTPDQLHAIGLRNLEALVEGQPGLRSGREGAMTALLLDGHFEASLVLLDALWDGPLAQQAPHGAVVALPARDICAFCDARSPEGIQQLRDLAKRVSANGDHLVTQRLFRRSGGRWTPLPG